MTDEPTATPKKKRSSERRAAPPAKVRNVLVDNRLKTEQEMDAAFPEYKHSWADMEIQAVEKEQKGLEVAHDKDGNRRVYGHDMLFRTPRAMWDPKRGAEEEVSFSRVKRYARRPEDLKKTRKPVKPTTRAERYAKTRTQEQ